MEIRSTNNLLVLFLIW